MQKDVPFFTDTASITLFDPGSLEHRKDDGDWWTVDDFSELPEVREGVISLIGLGSDSSYLLRVTDGDLTQDERDYAAYAVKGLGVEVVSGKLFAGPGECLPGLRHFSEEDVERGAMIELPNGAYRVDVYAIFWASSKAFWSKDGNELLPETAPADYVAVIRKRTEKHQVLTSEPTLKGEMKSYMFESDTRQVGPDIGMVLRTSVGEYPDGTLGLHNCGPGFYSPTADDMSECSVGDIVHFEVAEVDHDECKMHGVLI